MIESSRRGFLISFVSAAAPVAATFCQLRAAGVVNIGMIPDAGATQVAIDQKVPLRDYLAKSLSEPVNLVIPTNYNATVEALGNGSLDFAYLGGLTYVKAHAIYGVKPVIQRSEDRQFHSLFITASRAIVGLSDLRRKRFAFGDINSTSGHLIPHSELKKAGIDPDRDLEIRYTGSHPATAKAVESGAVDAGALDESVYKALVSAKEIDASKVRVFHTSSPFVDYVWVARKGVPAGLSNKFAEAFLNLRERRDSQVLAILRGSAFVLADEAEYTQIEAIARELKLL